ncbi:class II aldolase/adducin family protein [Georgenia sp. EYE_87]|uniref:class II aldolase/adducin family protein n=1 Tax=Georgenia sp. EYE_87 TaxID=2853448 RepID=UPI00200598DD|nr:class II aldolase/adducin family protein [Georgenia sp. EYE_87]MCK6210850.1 class II aldolase/adducin family protein [Georgenia sp. EYE_87]
MTGWGTPTGVDGVLAQRAEPGVNRWLRETLHASRLLGRDPFLVLHGGGNTSVKTEEDLWAKASGFDLGRLDLDGLVRLDRTALARMLRSGELSDLEMMAGYAAASRRPGAPAPTIESLLHHALPFRSVLHTHADAIVALTDTVHGPDLAAQVLGDDVIVVPYVMPGFELAMTASAAWQARRADRCTAIVLAHHGLFTMGDDVAEAYDRHLELVRRAEEFLGREAGWRADPFDGADGRVADVPRELRAALDAVAHTPPAVAVCADREVTDFVTRADLPVVSQRGPTTLEHVIRTKRLPLLGRDVDAYAEDYTRYFERHAHRSPGARMLDPTPRVILDPELGLVTTGPDPATAQAVLDIFRHTIRIIEAAERLGGYRTMTEAQAFDIEYWELEQRRLRPVDPSG